jgi:hypothetical protein
MQPPGRTVEQVTGEIASRQHGVVARAQLVDAGITPEEIKQRVRKGALLRIHRGVYRVGHTAHSAEARYLAAILACGSGAVLSGRPAAYLLKKAGLPLPETNQRVGGRLADCRWPQWNVTVELDGYRFHGSRHAWELDRRREREAYGRGDQFRRYTHGDVFDRPNLVLRELRPLRSGGQSELAVA